MDFMRMATSNAKVPSKTSDSYNFGTQVRITPRRCEVLFPFPRSFISCGLLCVLLGLSLGWTSSAATEMQQVHIVVLNAPGFRETQKMQSNSFVSRQTLSQLDFKATAYESHKSLLQKVNAGLAIHSFTEVVNGFSALLTGKQAQDLRDDSAVLFVAKDRKVKPLTTRSYQFLGLNNVPAGIWRKSTGSDAIVGVIDAGIWPESQSFSDVGYGPAPSKFQGACDKGTDKTFFCNNKLIGARYFGDGFAAANGSALSVVVKECGDYLSPRGYLDDGHGTHTSSTAAGSIVPKLTINGSYYGSAHGVAYSARLAHYKVFWCGASGTDSDVVMAMDTAVADGVDVLSLSLGDGPDQAGYASLIPTYYFAYRATLDGVAVVFAAGNDGPSLFTVGNSVPWVLSVGASSIDRSFSFEILLGNKATIVVSVQVGTLKIFGYSSKKMVRLVDSVNASLNDSSFAEICSPGSLDPAKVKGAIVVCKRGSITFVSKISTVQAAGGVGIIVYDQSFQSEMYSLAAPFPALLVSYQDGLSLKRYISTSKHPTALIRGIQTKVGSSVEAPIVASFSSSGPSGLSQNIIKPDVVAPGFNIIAAVSPLSNGVNYDVLSGTSMACPHAAGSVALLKTIHPTWTPSMLFSALMTTATVVTNRRRPIFVDGQSAAATPFQAGAGHINPNAAADPGLVYPIPNSDYDKFLCSPDSGLGLTPCFGQSSGKAVDLNVPSVAFFNVTVGLPSQTTRTLLNVGPESSYVCSVKSPAGTRLLVSPSKFKFGVDKTLSYNVTIVPTVKSSRVKVATLTMSDPSNVSSNYTINASIWWTFGTITWHDNKGHSVRINVAVSAV